MLDQFSTDHFKIFAKTLENELKQFGKLSDKVLLSKQKEQVERLVQLENEFKALLISHPQGPAAYKEFVRYITEDKRNILSARPFFRERQGVFTLRISPALKAKDYEALYEFHFNFQFLYYIMNKMKWEKDEPLSVLYRQIAHARYELTVMNMPLAINRSRLFWSKTPKAQLSFMDFVQISCEGLLSAIDKFVPPFTKVFRSVIIGRMVGYFIENYSETQVHFYPSDKRKIYRANKAIHKYLGDVDHEALAQEVNANMGNSGLTTTSSEIHSLMSAASCVSSDTAPPSDPDAETTAHRFVAPNDCRPDVKFEEYDTNRKVAEIIEKHLSPFEQKFLRLKGIDLRYLMSTAVSLSPDLDPRAAELGL